jgi:hypothetical protein
MEALQRLQQFDVGAAHAGAEATATALQAKKVPFCVFTEPRATAMPLVVALVITLIAEVVAAVAAMLARGGKA